MLTTLDLAVEDARAETLAFTLDEPPLDALSARTLLVGGLEVELRLLGPAHQVIAGPVVETVAALPGRPGPLPYELRREVGGWSHRFTADVYRRDAADFGRAVAFLRDYLETHPNGIAAAFAHRPAAISGVMLKPVRRGLDWRAWHTFPDTREIVVTRSRMLIH
jgi:hypothetical protein